MNIYEVYYYSSCGTYFAAYLKSVCIVATDEDDARNKTVEWCKKNGYSFLADKPEKLGARLLSPDRFGVIDFDASSDY